jgi:hypothetical protein
MGKEREEGRGGKMERRWSFSSIKERTEFKMGNG